MRAREQIFADIAKLKLHISTLETRNSDRLDFHEVSVASVREALEAAFNAGVEHCQKELQVVNDQP
jgi:hypothetical protein